jgi:hypothetical protein
LSFKPLHGFFLSLSAWLLLFTAPIVVFP